MSISTQSPYFNVLSVSTIRARITVIHTGLFLSLVIFALLLHLQKVLPCLEFALTQLCFKRDHLRH